MPTYETLSLDGLSITGDPTGTLILEQFSAPPPKAKPEWISAADSEWAALSRNPLHENREITLRVRVKQQTNMDLAFDRIGDVRDKLAKAAMLTDVGVPMTWSPTGSARTVTFDVLHGEITDLPIEANGDGYGWFLRTPIFTVTLTAKPYARGTEVLTSASTTATPVKTLEVPNVPGDIPALGRLIVTDAGTQNRRYVEYGIENQYYVTPGTATPLLLDSDSLVTSGFAGAQTTAGSMYDPNATGTNAIRMAPTTAAMAMAGTGAQSHVGTFRVWGKFASSSIAGTHKVRIVWHVGDGPYAANPWAPLLQASTHQEVDLGIITIPPATMGTQRWDARIEAYDDTGDTGTAPANLDLDFLSLIPAAEGYGVARSTYRYQPGVIVARDEFTGTTAGGTLNTRVAPLGGTWATTGATTDYVFADASGSTQERIQRATTTDVVGRFATLGSTNYTDVEVGARLWRSTATLSGLTLMGILARYVDSSNYLLLGIQPPSTLILYRTIAGVSVSLGRTQTYTTWANLWYRLRLIVFASGRVWGSLLDDNGNELARITAGHSDLATGGTLATGKPGVFDGNQDVVAVTRLYDDFYAATPTAEPVTVYSGRSIQFRHDTTLRQDSGGTYYGRFPSRGSRFLVPPGTSRVAVRDRRNDILTQDAITVTESTTLQVAYTPRYLVVPR